MFKIVCNQKNLAKAIAESQKAISNRTNMDILKNFYLEAIDNSLKIIGYDLEIAITSRIDVDILEEGKVLINAKLFSDIIRKLPNTNVEIFIENDFLNIICEKSHFKLKFENADEYPTLPITNNDKLIKVKQGTFKQMIKETVFATSQDQTKPVLMGELLEIKNGTLNLIAIDGYRLATSTNEVSSLIEDTKVVIPSKTLLDVSSLLNSDNEDFELGFDDKHAMFIIGNITVISRLLEGQFIDYKRLLKHEHNSFVTVNRRALLESIDRASLLISDRNNLIKLSITDDLLNITSHADMGGCNENVSIELSGDSLEIGFNSRYLMEALKVIESEQITMEFTNNVNPCIIKPLSNIKERDYNYLLLPVRMASR